MSLTATLMLSACADTAGLLPKASTTLAQTGDEDDKTAGQPQTELQKATTYWGMEYAKKPSELKPALNYARNLKALGEKTKALTVLQQAAAIHDADPELAGEYGRLALELDQVNVASRMLQIADNPAKPDWKVISARGTVLAKQGQYKDAIPFYERALTLAQNQPSVLNNLAMAYAMTGDAQKAESLLRQASASGNGANSPKVKQNLALVLGLEGRYDDAKALSAGTPSAVDTAENVDIVRRIVKLEPKPSAAPAAVASVPEFSTKVIQTAAAATGNAAPQMKASTVDDTSATGTVWQASATPAGATSGLRGAAQ